MTDKCPVDEVVRAVERHSWEELERRRHEVVVAIMVYHGGVRVEPGEDRVSIRHGGWLGRRVRQRAVGAKIELVLG